MIQSMLNRRRFGAILLLLLSLPGLALAHGARKDLVVFGDSLSDPGNVYALTGAYSLPPYEVIPTYPYLVGLFHFSNGPTWVEQLALTGSVNLKSAGPAFRIPGIFTNYAVGGSRARAVSGDLPEQGLNAQVQRYLADFGGNAKPNATHVIFMGGNDIRDALVASIVDPTLATTQQILTAAVTAVATNIQVLYAAGARHFVVVSAPDVGIAPAVRMLGPQAQAGATYISSLYNQGLGGAVAQLSFLPGIQITPVDIFTALDEVVAHPGDYGLTNVTGTCLTFGVTVGVYCSKPSKYLFWDGIHPTAAGHRILAMVIGPAL